MRGASEESDQEYSKYFAGATERATKQTLAGTLSQNAARTRPGFNIAGPGPIF